MNRLLVVSYFFPPYGGAGVQRALKLVRAAPALGWQVPAVISAEPGTGEALDRSMLAEVPTDTEVARPTAWRAGNLSRWVGPWLTPDPYVGWLSGATDAARSAAIVHRPDAIFSTSMPYTAHLVARQLKRETGLPWVADLRDPWTDNRFLPWYQGNRPSSRFRRFADGRLERSVYAEADLITVTAEPLARLLVERHGLDPAKVLLARNGYDEDDFAGVLPMPTAQPAKDTHALRFLFAGSIYEGYTFEPFMAALEELGRRDPELPVVFDVVTQNQRLYERFAPKYPWVQARTALTGRLSHNDVVRRYQAADVLVLSCLDDLSIPGKLFEYIRSGTPVLAFAVPGAEAHGLLQATGTGWCAPHDDVSKGADLLAQLAHRWRSGQPMANPDAAAVAQLERRVEYAKIFARMDQLVAART